MKRMQARIGYLLASFSLALFFIRVVYCIFSNLGIEYIVSIRTSNYLILALIFFLTTIKDNLVSKIVQIAFITAVAIISLCSSTNNISWGILIIIIDILLCYEYKFYDKRTHFRFFLSGISLYSVFVFIPLKDNVNKYIIAFEWTAIIVVFILAVWFIFKDAIQKIHDGENKDKERYLQIIEEATSVARDALNALEKLGNKKDC